MRRTTVSSAGAVLATALVMLAPAAPVAAAPLAPSVPTTPIVEAVPSAQAAATAARASLVAQAPARGLDPETRDLTVAAVTPIGEGDQVVRFQQRAAGVPVYAGELAVQVDQDGSVTSVSGETARVPGGGLARTVAPSAAQATALRTARARPATRGVAVTASSATAYVYDPVLVGEPDTGPRPVWQVVVSGPPASGVTVEVLVDARTGKVAEVIDRTQRLTRTICDNENSTTSNLAAGSWCTPQDYNGYFLTTIDASRPQAQRAFADLGDVSDFYADVLGVDLTRLVGLDTARPYSQRQTPALTATVNYCEAREQCPYANAFWVDADPRFLPGAGRTYPGGQVFLGQGLADSEDVVAHEITHGVTSAVNGLKYLNQSGAINESMSDVFGQLSQLYDHHTRTFVPARDPRWLIGERLNVPGLRGAVRSMSNPSTTSLLAGDPQPNRMTSTYWESSGIDSGGVHLNNGVGNKTAYLIARGGTFNGFKVRAIGERSTARLYWRAQHLLTSGANYRDLAIALAQSCNSLFGINSPNCSSVRAATAATEIAKSTISMKAASWKVTSGNRRTIRAQLLSFRRGSVNVRSSQGVRLVLDKRYSGSKKWKKVSTKRVSAAGKATFRVYPKRKVTYRVRYVGSTPLGLRGSSVSHKITIRKR